VLVRADSSYYTHDVVAAARRGGARFSITARMTATVKAAIGSIGEDAWTAIRYPNAIWDEAEQRWISDAEVAEVPFTAFTGRRKADHVTARLIVRRVKRLNPDSVPAGQGELFTAYRYHAVFTDSPQPTLQAETTHRQHAVIEQVHRRPQGRAAGPPPVGVVRGELRLAGARDDGVQPHPRRRRPGLGLPRQGDHLHHPRPADQRAYPDRPLRPPATAAPAPRLALATSLDPALRRHLRTTGGCLTDHRPTGPDRKPEVNSRTDRQSTHAQTTQPRSDHGLMDPTKIDGDRGSVHMTSIPARR
jgi:hypothetical protein